MHLNTFAEGLAPLDMTKTDEFQSLLESARDLGIPHSPDIAYCSRNMILGHQRFHFLEWGDASNQTIVLLHGGHQSAHSWDLVSLSLSDRYHILALDQRGHGDSEWARDGDYATETLAVDAANFIRTMELEKPMVFGHSMGGLVTMTVLRDHLDLVGGAVIVDVGPEIGGEGVRTIADFIQTSSEFNDLEEFVAKVQSYDPFRSREHIERTVRYNLMKRADGKYVSKCDFLRGGIPQGGPPPKQGAIASVTLEDAKKFDCPVLLVRGSESNVLEPDAAVRFAEALPQGQLVTVPKSGHNVHGQNTPGFLEAVGAFLEG